MFIVNSTSPFERSNILHLTRLSEGRDVLGKRTRSQWKPTRLNLRVLRRIVRKQIGTMEKATGTKVDVLKRILPEFFQDQTKHNHISAMSAGATIIQNKQDAIRRIWCCIASLHERKTLHLVASNNNHWGDYNRTKETILRQEKVYSHNGRRITRGLHFYNVPHR